MGLMEQLEEDKRLLEEMEGEEVAVVEEEPVEEEAVEEVVEEPEAEVVEEPVAEEPVEEVAAAEEPTEDVRNNEYYKTRRENAALKKQLADRDAAQVPVEEPVAAPDGVDPRINEVLHEMDIRKAGQEFEELEAGFASHNPEYNAAAEQYRNSVYHAQKINNPHASHQRLLEMTRNDILYKARDAIHNGLDPIEEVFNIGNKAVQQQAEVEKQWQKHFEDKGFKLQETADTPDDKAAPTVNHDKLASNRQRNAGTVGAKGAGGTSGASREFARTMTNKEWVELPPADKAEYMKMLQEG